MTITKARSVVSRNYILRESILVHTLPGRNVDMLELSIELCTRNSHEKSNILTSLAAGEKKQILYTDWKRNDGRCDRREVNNC